jgi:hypothetical protein
MDLFDDIPRRRKQPAGYLPLFDDATLFDEPVSEDSVSPEERDSVLRELGAVAGGTLSRVGDALSAPGDYVRGVLAGKPGERIGGRELLREYGLAGDEDNWGNFAAGMAADVFTDPLSFVSGPATSLTKAGRAAQKLNLLDNAALVSSKKALRNNVADEALPMVARQTKEALESSGRKLNELDPALKGRPLYGTRTARRDSTLGDLIDYADDPAAAEEAARKLLGGDYDALRGEKLANTFGLGLPFKDAAITGDVFGKGFGDNYADALDTLGQSVRWSGPGRYAAAAFNNKVGGALDAEQQMLNIANFEGRQAARAGATQAHTLDVAKLYDAHPEVFSEDGNRIMGRVIEGKGTAADLAYVDARPEFKRYIDDWRANRGNVLDESRRAGIGAAEMKDAYGAEYLPRSADAALELAAKRDRKLGKALSAMTGDQLRRTDAMQIPGGRDKIMELSQDAMVSGPKRTASTDEEAADYLMSQLSPLVQTGQPALDRKNMIRLARILHDLPDDVTKKVPLFGQHPVESIGSYYKGRAEAMSTMDTMLESLASFAADAPYTKVPDAGRHITVQDALNRIGGRTYKNADTGEVVGAKELLKEKIARIWGRDPDKINLAEISMPEEVVNRLTKARDVYESGEVSSQLLKVLDHYTQAWRGSILTWPSRAVRDLYSGAISNWLEGAFDPEAVLASKALLAEGTNAPAFQKWLSRQTRYAGDDGAAQFLADLASTELLTGSSGSGLELGASTLGQRALDPILGAQPATLSAALQELAPQAGRSWGQFAKDFGTWRSSLRPTAENLNPVLRAGERLNNLTDGVNRASGFMSLIAQGYDPAAAAKAMKRAHVDYSSLTSLERNVLKRIFPWYSYQSRIFREVLRQLAERPGGRYGQMIQGMENAQESNDEQYIPSGLRSQFAAPLPEMLGGNPAPGTTRYITDIDAPGFDQINMVETPGTLGGMFSGTARQIMMQTAPVIRLPAEWAFGTDLFTNRPVGEATSPLDAIGRAVTGDQSLDVPSVIDKGVEMLPFVGRPLYLARSLTDSRGGADLGSRAAKALVNATTGIKFRDVSQEDAVSDATRQIEESIDPYTREFKQVYIPEAMQPQVPQWALRRNAVARALGRERRQEREKRSGKKKGKRKSDTGSMNLFE